MKRFSLLIIACLAGTPLQAAPDAAGRIVFSSGSNQIIDAGGKSRPARQGDGISPGDRLQTDTGHLQVRFADNGFISLKPKSQLVVSEFVFNGREDGTEKAFFNLLKGSMRAVTGLIGRRDRKPSSMKPPSPPSASAARLSCSACAITTASAPTARCCRTASM
jgi:hypothetical protein